MKPTYEVRAWQEDGWWLARVVAASDGADPAPLNAITQARTLAKIDRMAHDLIATILDADEDIFDVELEYVLPDDVGELLREARGARAWLDAAQERWQERSAATARALTGKGYSLREAAKLLGLSHQRVDQLLGGDVGGERSSVPAAQSKHQSHSGSYICRSATERLSGLDVLVVIHCPAEGYRRRTPHTEEIRALHKRIEELLTDCAERTAQPRRTSEAPPRDTRNVAEGSMLDRLR